MINTTPRPGRRGPRLLLALALGAAAAAGVYLYVSSVQQQAQANARAALTQASAVATSRSSVVVAKVSLAAGSPLSPDNVELRDLPAEAVQPNAITTLGDVTGKALTVPVAAGEQILSHRVASPDQPDIKKFADLVPAGKRAMSVTFTELSSAGGLIAPGDYVDVLGVFNKNTLGKDQSMILLQDVLVLAVAQNTSADQLPRQGAANAAAGAATPRTQPNLPLPTRGGVSVPVPGPTPASVPVAPAQTRTVTLAVDPEAAERLALAEDYGHLRYIVRPGSERNQSAVLPADLSTLASPIQVAAGQIIATQISPTNTKVGDTLDISITVKNTSDKPLQTMGPEPGFTYVQGQTYFTQQFASDPGKWRVALGSAGLDATEMPYRWGLGGDLAPGATTTVSGHVKITQDFKTTNFWAALVNEPSTIVQTGVGMTLITSLPENLAIVAVDAANVRSGPSIASSVIDQVKYGTELQIVGQSADWFKIKLPDQREGWVAAGWIVTAAR
ncbi:MAG: Flp pilus assembly protein CpaB [Chloroflexota bacterium]